jgi:hypothetical protein
MLSLSPMVLLLSCFCARLHNLRLPAFQLPPESNSGTWSLPVFAAANGRSLLQQFTGASGFPYCRCLDYSPSSSPYTLTGPTVTPLENGAEKVCFMVQATPNANTSAPCYGLLASSLHKIAFETSYSCFADRAFYGVTVNGNTQHFDVSVCTVAAMQQPFIGSPCAVWQLWVDL